VKNKKVLTWKDDMINNFETLKQIFVAAPCQAPTIFSQVAKPFISTIHFSKHAWQ